MVEDTFISTWSLLLIVSNWGAYYNQSIDPAGEGGKFHTVVLNSPLFYREMVINAQRECESDRYHYLKFDVEMGK